MDLPSSSIVCIIDWLIRYKWATRRETDMWEESEEGLEGAGEVWPGPPAESSPRWGGVYELGTQPLDALLPHWVTAESPWIYPGRPIGAWWQSGGQSERRGGDVLWRVSSNAEQWGKKPPLRDCVLSVKQQKQQTQLLSLWGWSQTHEKPMKTVWCDVTGGLHHFTPSLNWSQGKGRQRFIFL